MSPYLKSVKCKGKIHTWAGEMVQYWQLAMQVDNLSLTSGIHIHVKGEMQSTIADRTVYFNKVTNNTPK